MKPEQTAGRSRMRCVPRLVSLVATTVVAAALLALVPAPAPAMPPSPALLRRASRDPGLAARIAAAERRAKAVGIDAPAVDRFPDGPTVMGAPSVLFGNAAPSSGPLNTIALVVDFSDRVHLTAASFFDSLLFADVFGPASVRGYYREVSYGTPSTRGLLDVVTSDPPSTTGWLRMPQTLAYYVAGGSYGKGTYPNNARRMVQDAVAAADPLVDFSQYDVDGDGFVDNLVVIHAGEGAELTGSSGDIWSHKWSTVAPISVDGVQVSTYTTEPEYWVASGDMTTGVFAHEMGHVLGLPDLYDRDYTSEGIGDWSLMAGGAWNGSTWPGGDSPARMDAWSSAQLGWLQPQTLTTTPSTRTVPTVGSSRSTSAYRVYPGGATSGPEYFLVENRQQTGTDTGLPGSGLLVWHIDETRTATQNDDESHKLVDLEEAAGPQDMDSAANRGAPDDPFPGTSGNRSFTDVTDPNANTYAGVATRLVVEEISDSSASMTARIGVLPDVTPPVTTHDSDGLWHNTAVTVGLTAYDDEGGSGMSGGSAKTEYSRDGGETWIAGQTVTYSIWKRGGGSGVHTLLYRSTDAAGNTEVTQSWDVLIDARPPLTSDDAPFGPQTGDVMVYFTAADSLFGVTACSGVAATWYSVDGGGWTEGAQVAIPAAGNAGVHWIAYYSIDNAGNAEYVKWCSVTIAAAGASRHAVRSHMRR